MPTVFIPFGDWTPDGGFLNNAGLVECSGVVPYGGGYAPLNTIEHLSANLASLPNGLHVHPLGPTTYRIYFGTSTALKEVNPATAYSVTDRSGAVYTPPTGDYAGWQFTSFGPHVIATNYDNLPQIQLNGAGNFTTMITAGATTLRARFVSSIKNHVLLGNYFESGAAVPEGVWWGATDDARSFGTPAANPTLIGTDKQPLYDDYGHVTGLVGGDYALIFKERAVIRMDGPPFSFAPLAAIGTRYPNSIVRVQDDVYFWSQDGPRVVRGGTSVQQLGLGKCRRFLADPRFNVRAIDPTQATWELQGASDPASGLVFWVYPIRFGGFAGVVYNIDEDRFTELPSTFYIEEQIEPTVYEHARLLATKTDTGAEWCPGRDLILVSHLGDDINGFHEYYISRFTRGTSSEAMPINITTGYYQLADDGGLPLRSTVDWVRPMLRNGYSGGATASSTRVTSFDGVGFYESVEGVEAPDDRWTINSERHHKHSFNVTVGTGTSTAGLTDVEGVEVSFTPTHE